MEGVDAWRRDLWLAIGTALTAHVVVLQQSALLDDACAAAILEAIDATSRGEPPAIESAAGLTAVYEQRVDAITPAACAALSRTGRGNLDVAATAHHLLLRQHGLALMEAAVLVRLTLIELAGAHVFTLLPVYIGSSPMQPSNLAHVLTAAIAPLRRATARLHLALADLDQIALGSGSLAGASQPIDRDALASLLGADAVPESTLDALSSVDEFVAASQAAAAIVHPMERLMVEFLALVRQEPQSIMFDDALLAPTDASLPHFRPPQVLERCLGDARGVLHQALVTERVASAIPFGPRGEAGDGLAQSAARAMQEATRVCQTFAMLISGPLDFNRAWLARNAGRNFMTAGDLAAILVAEEGLPQVAARDIAALVTERARDEGLEASGITPGLIDAAAMMVIGRELGVEIERLGAYLAPRRFIEKRSALGGPAPVAVRELLDIESQRVARDQSDLETRQRRIADARKELGVLSHEIASLTS
ncbi:MAG: lyase family protein [Chloroflexota bacterium]|nr:lyase family protein [Chloroflexota bacterium]